MGAFLTSDGLVALATLTALEIVLGVDNLVFITRVLLLLTLSWIMGLTRPMFHVAGHGVAGRDLILLAGGLFLMTKATWEIYAKVEGVHEEAHARGAGRGMLGVVVQIMILDIVFSLDSVITAVGMVDDIPVMVAAIVLAMVVMLLAMDRVSHFVEAHPSVKILALSFLILIGVVLMADGLGHHLPKGYVYFPMAFALGVELLNLRYRTLRGR